MRKHYFLCMRIVGMVCLFSLVSLNLSAQWKLLKSLPATYAMFITQNGNMLMSDLLVDRTGGIYLSKDKGATWEKSDIADYNYSEFYEYEDYVFATGKSGRIARSNDSGETWELVNYTLPLKEKGIFDDNACEGTVCYAMTYHNGKLFVGDYNGGGILYSEDMGETWNMTDLNSLRVVPTSQGKCVENFKNLTSFNGKLYAFGIYFVFEYLEDNDTWVIKRNDSNFMSQITIFNGKMYCGRSIMNETDQSPFLERTADGESWEWVPRPEGLFDNNVRVINHDEKNIYVGLQTRGLYYTDNEGESWAEISDGLPVISEDFQGYYISPLQISVDNEYVYVSMFDFNRDDSGIYRMAKADLPPTPTTISNLPEKSNFRISVSDSYLQIIGHHKSSVSLFNVYGSKLDVNECNGLVDIRNLTSGIYIFEVLTDKGKIIGKFYKK